MSSEAERLAIAGAVAPILRSIPDRVTKRRVKVYSRETGETLREAEYGEALRGLAEAYALEHAIDEAQAHESAKRGVRRSLCQQCGLEFEYPNDGGVRAACGKCKTLPCAGGCGRTPPKSALEGTKIRRRRGRPWVCKSCAGDVRRSKPKRAPKQRVDPICIHGSVCRSCAMRQALNRPETKERLRHRKRPSPEAWARCVEKQKEAWLDPERRAIASERSRKLAQDPDWRAKTAEASARGIAAKVEAGK